MRLIQPTLLLLLVAINCDAWGPESSCPLFPNCKEKHLNRCLPDKCIKEEDACKKEPHCLRHFGCMWKYCAPDGDMVTCYNKCKPSKTVLELRQCAADKACIRKNRLSCPGVKTKGREVLLNQPDLVEQLKEQYRWAVLTADGDGKGAFNYACSKYGFSGDKNNVGFSLSNCFGNSTRGKCSTEYTTFSGNGKQNGDTGMIELTLDKKDQLVGNTRLIFYVHEIEEEYALVSLCMINDIDRYLSKMMILSPFKTFQELYDSIDSATWKRLGEAINRFKGLYGHRMNNARYCTN